MPSVPPKGSVASIVAGHALAQPEKNALVVDDRPVSYHELWECSLRAARRLVDAGVGRGDCVVLHATHSLSYVAAYLGATYLGAVAVPYEESLPAEGVLELADRVGATAVVAPKGFDGALAVLDENEIASAGDLLPEQEGPDQDELAELLLTTGTTGRSKVVSLTHGAVMAVIENIVCATGIEPDNVSLVPMPLNHVFALRRLQTGLVMGATVVLINGVASLKRFYRALSEQHVTSLSLVPSALAYVEHATKDFIGRFDGQIRFVESSSAPLPASTRSWLRTVLPSARLYNSYGCTESTACCMLEYSHREDDGACVGTPCVTASIKILDLATGEEVHDVAGRVAIGGAAVMSGYWGDEAATAETLRDGLVLTNDLGYFREGELYVQGRIDDVAIIGGHNVSPVEVEDVISTCPLVAECACVKGSDPITGDCLVLFVAWEGKGASEKDLEAFMHDHLEPFKVPSHVCSIDAVPRTYNGKLDRKPLLERARELTGGGSRA